MILREKPPKILIIDHDPSAGNIFGRFLTTHGYQVITSTGAREALSPLRSEFFNLIIFATYLPGEDGFSLLSKIKNFSPDTEVITISDCRTTEAAIESFRLGAFDYLMKPIAPDVLLQVVKKAIEKQNLEFEKRHSVAEIKFRNILLEREKDLLEAKLAEDDGRVFRLMKWRLLARRLFEKMIQSLPFGAMVIDKQGRILMCNKAQEMFCALPKDLLSGKDLFTGSLPKELEPWQEVAKDFLSKKCYEAKVVKQCEVNNRILSITLSPFIDDNGRPMNFILLSADITNEKRVEEQIIQSEKMTAIGQLITSLAHQIRNPLAIIGSATQCCLEKGGSENGLKKHFEIIYRNVQNANTIISDLLDFAKPKPLEFKKNDINKILTEVCAFLKLDFSKNKIKILRHFGRRLPKILCDKESLKQAFFNLLMNSKQAMPNGGVISILTSYNCDGQTVNIIIKDTGKGIRKEDMPNIFNPYFTTKEKGTGLGLSIVHRIISDHRGKILAESEEGKGTKMNITFPVHPVDSKSQPLGDESEQYTHCG